MVLGTPMTGMPVWGYAFDCTRHRRLKTWDRMRLPRPFGKGRIVFARWDHDLPRKADAAAISTARAALATHLDQVSERASAPPT